jgi:hypothetical protein
LRWDGKCIITCPENYERRLDERRGEYVCIPKRCEDRSAWRNKSCSLKEDFISIEEYSNNSNSRCYYFYDGVKNVKNDDDDKDMRSNSNDNIDDENNNMSNNNKKYDINMYDDLEESGRCVNEGECPVDYPGVCYFFKFDYILLLFVQFVIIVSIY